MMQVVPRWRVDVRMPQGNLVVTVVFWVNATSVVEVMGVLGKLQFSPNGLDQPLSITIALDAGTKQEGVSYS